MDAINATKCQAVLEHQATFAEFSPGNRTASLIFWVFYSAFFVSTCAWWVVRRDENHLQKRSFGLMFISGLGIWFGGMWLFVWQGRRRRRGGKTADLGAYKLNE